VSAEDVPVPVDDVETLWHAARTLAPGCDDGPISGTWRGSVTATNDGLVRIWSTRTWTDPIALDAGEGPALSLAIAPDGRRLAAGYQSGAIVLWDLVAHRLETRIGGRTRDRGSYAQLGSQAWIDEAHRAIVAAACAERAEDHVTRLAARSHQRIDGEVDATWDWLPPSH
jgi:hypothetical protein